ncbi:hypothetical protein KBY93_03940 [Synechococcus sp. J7-Johnson]|nr:hypothetical protein [Synechococcus sp. J7-Johnson]
MLLSLAAAPAKALDHWRAFDILRDRLAANGVRVKQRDCGQRGLQGLYHPSSETIVVCRVHSDPVAVWNTLAHEATHRMQVCRGGPITDPRHHRAMAATLANRAPLEWRSLQSYPPRERLSELEARYTAQLPPDQVIQLFDRYCGRRSSAGLAFRTPSLR